MITLTKKQYYQVMDWFDECKVVHEDGRIYLYIDDPVVDESKFTALLKNSLAKEDAP